MKFVSILLVSASLFLVELPPAISQESKPPAPLSLQECLKIAVQNQIDVQVAENNLSAANARSTRAKSEYYPQLSINNNTFNIGSQGVLTQSRTGTALTVTQNIYDGGQREARVKAARYNVTGSQAGLTRTFQTVSFDVTGAYYEVLRRKHLADVANASVKYNEQFKELIQSRIEVGDAAEVDVLPVDAQLANARVSLLAAQNDVQIATVQLQNTIGLSPQPGFDIQDVTGEPSVELKPLDTYVSEAVVSRPDVTQAKANVGAAKAAVKSTRIALYPVPDISAQYQIGLGNLEGDSTQLLGGITLDLFNGGRTRANYKEALAVQSTALDQSLQVNKDIKAQVQGAYLNLNSARERLTASRSSYEAAQRNYEVQQAKYKQGLAITLDLLNAEVQAVTAQTNLVQARYDYYTAIAQMDFAVGKEGGFNAG